MKPEHVGYRRLMRSMRLMTDARMILDMLSHRLREDGPEMTREEIKRRVDMAAEKINQLAPRSPLRDEA